MKRTNDIDYNYIQRYRKTNKFYCDYCKSYTYIKDSVDKVLCSYCNHYIFNTNNPDGKKEYFKYKMKKLLK